MRGGRMPAASTLSRQRGESPATLPKAHTACSRTSSLVVVVNRPTNTSTAPHSTTILVCSEEPDAMFVNAQAASNCELSIYFHLLVSHRGKN